MGHAQVAIQTSSCLTDMYSKTLFHSLLQQLLNLTPTPRKQLSFWGIDIICRNQEFGGVRTQHWSLGAKN